jgi:CHASE3 domain sensor protein
MIRKAALLIGVPILLALIAWNAYLSVKHMKQVQENAALTLNSAVFPAKIAAVLQDVTDMETGQRGYLLTGSSDYLQPYTDAKNRLAADFATLHTAFANRMQRDQSLEAQLESLTQSKQAEMERSISLRQQGYRKRAFNLVDTNEGKGYMDDIRRIAASLSSAESGNLARFETEKTAAVKKIWSETILANSALFALAVFLFWLMRYHERVLAKEASRSKAELAGRDLQLKRLMSALSGQARSSLDVINTNSHLLLENYGSFLPRQAHEHAVQLKEAGEQMERLRQDLVGNRGSESNEAAA